MADKKSPAEAFAESRAALAAEVAREAAEERKALAADHDKAEKIAAKRAADVVEQPVRQGDEAHSRPMADERLTPAEQKKAAKAEDA